MTVRFDRRIATWALIAALLMCWPLALTGRPAYIADSLSYLKGGKTAVAYVTRAMSDSDGTAVGSTASVVSEPPAAEARGARSILYSVAAYVLRFPGDSMLLLAIAQALIVGLMIAMLARGFGVARQRDFLLVAGVVAFATPAAPTTSFAIPDIFAGVAIAVWVLIACCWTRLSTGLRVALTLLGAFAVTSHASHVPLAAGLVLTAVMLAWLGGERGKRLRTVAVASAWPLILGLIATVGSGLIGFGTVSVAPKRYPLTLARSIEDGPGRWYLERHCADRRYTVCEIFGRNIPRTVPEILWGSRGIVSRATPAQLERIRDQEQEIVVAAAREFPMFQVNATLANIGRQLVDFGLAYTPSNERIVQGADGEPAFAPASPLPTAIVGMLEWLSIVSAAAASVWLAVRWRRLDTSSRMAVALVTAGIVGNAIICAAFSGAAPRYQARVIWLLPLIVMLLMLRRTRADT